MDVSFGQEIGKNHIGVFANVRSAVEMSSIYIRTRCPNCNSVGTYANDSKDIIVCDHCIQDFNKLDGLKLEYAPKQTKVKNELRKEIARRNRESGLRR